MLLSILKWQYQGRALFLSLWAEGGPSGVGSCRESSCSTRDLSCPREDTNEERFLFRCWCWCWLELTMAVMASISLRTTRMLASVSWMTLSCLPMLATSPSSSFSFMRQLRLQMGSYLPMPSLCFRSSSYRSQWISSAMKFSCLANCSTRRSIAFCRSAPFSLNRSIFSCSTRSVSSCFLWVLKARVIFCSSITMRSSIDTLFTRSRPCSSAFRFRSRLSLVVCLIRPCRPTTSPLSSSSRLGLDAMNLILSSKRPSSAVQVCMRTSLAFFSSSSSTRVPSVSLGPLALSFLARLLKAFFSMWCSTSSLSSFRHARNFSYSFHICVSFIQAQLASLVMCSQRWEQVSWGLEMVGKAERELPRIIILKLLPPTNKHHSN